MASARQQTELPRPALRGHSALARSLAPASDAASEVMAGATDRAARKLNDLARRAGHAGFPAARRAVAAAGIAATTEAIRIYRAGGVLSGMGELAWLSVVMADPWVRDDALTRLLPEHRKAHRRLCTELTVWSRPGYVAAPACLLAFTALQSGAVKLADLALDRALADRPGYRLALQLRHRSLTGHRGRDAAPPATAEQVAAWYERQLKPGLRRSGPMRRGPARVGGEPGPVLD